MWTYKKINTVDWFDTNFEKNTEGKTCLIYGTSFSKTSDEYIIAGGT